MHDHIIYETKIANNGVLLNQDIIEQYNNIKGVY